MDSRDTVKKQIESNLTPYFWRLLSDNAKRFVKAFAASGIVLYAAGRLLRIPPSPLTIVGCIAFSLATARVFTGKRASSAPLKEFDAFGNEIDQSNLYGSGRMMTEVEKMKFLEIFPESSPKGTILGTDPRTGMGLGAPDDDRPFDRSLDHRHFLLFGASGRGKTKFLKDRHRQILMQGFSDVYLDPKGELTEDVIRPCADAMGYMNKWLFRFRKDDIHLSNKVDLIKPIRTAMYPEIDAAWITSKVLGFKADAGDKDYWENSAKALLNLSLIAAARCEGYISIDTFLSTGDSQGAISEKGTWKTAVRVFRRSPEEVDAYFRYLRSFSPENDELLMALYNDWKSDERNWRGHVSSLRKKLWILAQDGVADVFSEDDVDFSKLASEPSTLGLIYDIPPGDFAPAFNLIIQLASNAILKNRTRHKTCLVLEELKIAGVIDFLEDYLAFFRSFGAQIIGCSQSYPQLKELYGEDAANGFFQNAHIIFAGGQESKTLEKMEELSGTRGIKTLFASQSVGGGNVRFSEGEEIVKSSVVDRNQLLFLPKGKLYVKLSNCGATILDSYNSAKHPLANVRYVDSITGRQHKLSLAELTPGFDPEEKGLKLVGYTPSVTKHREEEITEKSFLV